MKVALDRQHAGKPNSNDQGAVFADGTTEAFHAGRYIQGAMPILQKAGVQVVNIWNGSYTQRNAQANALGVDLYVACHVNAGGGEYALTEYNADTGVPVQSKRAATALLAASDDELGQKAVGPKALHTGERGHICVAGCKMPAVIYEPYFVEHPRLDVPDVARCLATGILNFLDVPQPLPTLEVPEMVVVEIAGDNDATIWLFGCGEPVAVADVNDLAGLKALPRVTVGALTGARMLEAARKAYLP